MLVQILRSFHRDHKRSELSISFRHTFKIIHACTSYTCMYFITTIYRNSKVQCSEIQSIYVPTCVKFALCKDYYSYGFFFKFLWSILKICVDGLEPQFAWINHRFLCLALKYFDPWGRTQGYCAIVRLSQLRSITSVKLQIKHPLVTTLLLQVMLMNHFKYALSVFVFPRGQLLIVRSFAEISVSIYQIFQKTIHIFMSFPEWHEISRCLLETIEIFRNLCYL